MPLTPHEALDKNRGKKNLQFERAVQEVLVEVERAIEYYTGNPVYVGLPAYLRLKAEEDKANRGSLTTLEAVDRAVDEHFGPAGWSASIVINQAKTDYWVKLKDARGR